MQRLDVSGVVRLIYRSLGVKGLTTDFPGQPVGSVFKGQAAQE
jgi:hypothetical protein